MTKNLYFNGCSFTAGHELLPEETWPFKLGELFNSRVINKAVNGNSMYAICHTTFHHLQLLPPEDTTVIIGCTWEGRTGILFDNTTVNITPVDLDKTVPRYKEKLSTWRRLCPVQALDLDHKIKIKVHDDWIDNDEFENTVQPYVTHVSKLVQNDPYYERNIQLEYKYNLTMLETYLKSKGYKYLFVDFQKYYYPERFVSFNITENSTSHPTAEDCTKYAEFIYNKLNNE